MATPICQRAIQDAHEHGKALVKFISPNDVELTGGHQRGFYLPIGLWEAYTPFAPQNGVNNDHPVKITWQDGTITDSIVKWYGQRTRHEYRLTRFQRGFPLISWKTSDNVGDLLVLIPKDLNEFLGYILDLEDDIEDLLAALGLQIVDTWGYFEEGRAVQETEDECLNRHFREFVQNLDHLPSVNMFSETTLNSILECANGFEQQPPDAQLLDLIKEEYVLYQMAERVVFQPEIQRVFRSIDDFLQTANSILQSRKSRAGRSLENHVEYLLRQSHIPFESQPILDSTNPDIIIPGKAQYDDGAFPINKLFVIGIKRTCKDRWRQVTREAPRINHKHILTLQKGMSSNQLQEMRQLNVSLIVPEEYHADYPPDSRNLLLSVGGFINQIKQIYPDD